MAELVAYLVVLRPGLPRVLAYEQAEAVAAACAPAPCDPTPYALTQHTPAQHTLTQHTPTQHPAAHPPRGLLVALARPALPDDPSLSAPAPASGGR